MRIYNRREDYELRKSLRENMTEAEVILWSKLKNRQIKGCKFRRQFGIDGYIVDFYCPKLRLAIEVDGSIHNLRENKEYDIERQRHIEVFNIKFLRFSNDEISDNLTEVLRRIKKYIAKHDLPLDQSSPPKFRRGNFKVC